MKIRKGQYQVNTAVGVSSLSVHGVIWYREKRGWAHCHQGMRNRMKHTRGKP